MTQDFNINSSSQWACILGGSSGLGLASAQKLAAHGLHICIVHRTRRSKMPDFEDQCKSIRALNVEVVDFNIDALQEKNIAQVIIFFENKKACIKVLVHSIAKGNLKPIYTENNDSTLTALDFQLTAQAMATSLYSWASAFAKAKLLQSNSRIIAFTSEGSTKPAPNYAAVSAAKAALEAIMRSLAFEYAALGITANCIQAGVTDTESLRLIPGSQNLKEQALKRNPYNRLTLPEDVANVVYLLARDESKWINGAVIPVDGGEHLQ